MGRKARLVFRSDECERVLRMVRKNEMVLIITFIDACVGVGFVREEIVRPSRFFDGLDDLVQ
jgi:hypothetical protein